MHDVGQGFNFLAWPLQFVVDVEPTRGGDDQVRLHIRQCPGDLEQAYAVNRAGGTRNADNQTAAQSLWRLVQQLVQLARREHFSHDIGSPDKFAIDIKLGNRRPV